MTAALTPLPVDAPLANYDAQAAALLQGHRAGVPMVLDLLHRLHPRFLDSERTWLPLTVSHDEIHATPLTHDDARLVVARGYSFRDWSALAALVEAVQQPASPVARFERAVEAVLDGDLPVLTSLLRAHPELAHARSTRVTCNDPAEHRATLLHYVAANGVEIHRQRTAANAVSVLRTLLEAGADPNALASFYSGECTTLSLLVSSHWPAAAGVQGALAEALIEGGADVEGSEATAWRSPLLTALTFGYRDTGEALVRCGAAVDTVVKAAGLGRTSDVIGLLASATPIHRHQALAIASNCGATDVVRVLLHANEDPNRYNPPGFHAHQTPLHSAAGSGYLDMAQLLVSAGARTDIEDTIHHATPLGWAEHAGQAALVEYLRAQSAGAQEMPRR